MINSKTKTASRFREAVVFSKNVTKNVTNPVNSTSNYVTKNVTNRIVQLVVATKKHPERSALIVKKLSL